MSRIRLIVFALLATLWGSAQNAWADFSMSMSAPAQVASGQGYSVSASAYFLPNYQWDSDFTIILYRNGDYVVESYGYAYNSATVSGSFGDSGPQTVNYEGAATSYYGEYDVVYGSVQVTGVNNSPSASISGSSSLLIGEGGSWSFSASDPDGNLYRWRFYASTNPNPQWTYVSGSSANDAYSTSFSSAGTYTWIVEVQDTQGASSSDSITVTVSKIPVTFTFSGATSYTYNGSSKSVSVSANPSNASYTTSGTWSATNAGSYSVSVTATGNYTGSNSASWSISPASASFSFSGGPSFTHDGNTKSVSVSASPSGATYSPSGTWSASAVGNYTASVEATGNYSGSGAYPWEIKSAPAPVNYTLTTEANPTVGGSVSGGGSYQSGTTATVSATANPGYTFSSWSGAASGTSTSASVTMNGNKTVTANFTPISYNLSTSVSPSGAGSVSGGGSYQSGTTATVTATANPGYTFSNWSGAASGTSTSASVTMNGNKTVTANFAAGGAAPVIASQSGDRVRSIGQSSPFFVNATGTAPLSYQWRKNGTPIAGATSSSYSISNVQLSDEGSYTVVVGNAAGSVTSNAAYLDVVERFDPEVAFPLVAPLQAQVNEQMLVGGSVVDSDGDLATIAAKWNGVLKQEWSGFSTSTNPDFGNLVDRYTYIYATGVIDQYAVFSMEATDATYVAGSSSGFGSRSTQVRVLGPNTSPVTTGADADVVSPSEIALSASATDVDLNLTHLLFYVSEPPSYNGYRLVAEVAVSGGTASGSAVWEPSPALADGTYYLWVKARDSYGAIDGTGAVTTFVVSSSGGSGGAPSISVSSGAIPSGQTIPVNYEYVPAGAVLALFPYTGSDSSPLAQVVLASGGSGTSNFSTNGLTVGQTYNARLFSGTPGSSTKLATSSSFSITENWTLTVENGSGGGTGLRTADTRTITANAPASGQVFAGWVHVSGPGRMGNPAAPQTTFTIDRGHAMVRASFSPVVPPAILVQPESLVRTQGNSAAFRVVASGAPTPTYQWRKNGVNIPGATLELFVLNSVQPGDAGSYSVMVSNAQGQVLSATATLGVETPSSITASIGVNPTWSVTAPGSTVVTWMSANATSVSVQGPGISVANSTAPNGSQMVSNLPLGRHTFTITTQTPTGPIVRSATFTVVPPTSGGQPVPPIGDAVIGALPGEITVNNRGGANYEVPLGALPGRGGLQPSLALSYASDGGNGPIGTGWSLATGFPQSITRGRTILARDGFVHGMTFNSGDRLYLDGKRLIHVSPTPTPGTYWRCGNVYRTEVDDFVVVTALGTGTLGSTEGGEDQIDGFKVETKAGLVMWFGRADSTSTDDARQIPGGMNRPYAWKLKRVQDTVGNRIEFGYSVYTKAAGQLTGEHLLDRINYTSNSVSGAAAENRVQLVYLGDTEPGGRTDVSAGYLGSGRIESRRRLAQIKHATREGAQWSDARIYTLNYDQSAGTGRSRLKTLTLSAKEALAGSWGNLGATVFTYSEEGADGIPLTNPLNVTVPPSWLSAASNYPLRSVSGDFNGDGRTDRFINGKVYLSNGSSFGSGQDWITLPSAPFVKAGDINGDGLTDIVWMDGWNQIKAARSTGTGFVGVSADGNSFDACALGAAAFDAVQISDVDVAMASRVSLGDFNGDGMTDVLVHRGNGSTSPGAIYVCLATGTGFATPERWGPISLGDNFREDWGVFSGYNMQRVPAVTQIEPFVTDINGDGIDDYAYIERLVSQVSQTVTTDVNLYASVSRPGYPALSRLAMNWSTYIHGYVTGPTTIGDTTLLKAWFGDCNGDGYKDLLVLKKLTVNDTEPKWIFYPATASGLTVDEIVDYMPQTDPTTGVANHNLDYQTAYNPSRYFYPGQNVQTSGMFLQDINGDGRADFIFGRDETDGWLVKYATTVGFGPAQRLWTSPPGDLIGTPYVDSEGEGGVSMEPVDINGDGAPDWLMHGPNSSSPVVAWGRNARIDLLVRAENGLGAKVAVSYLPGTDPSIYTPGAAVSYPIREMRSAQPVVSDIWRDMGSTDATRAHFSYQYSGRRLDLSGRGDLGFHSFVTLDRQTNLFKYQFLAQSFPMTGLTHREETYRWWNASSKDNFRKLSSHDNTVVFDRVAGGNGTLWPFISRAVESRWEDSSTAHFSFTQASVNSQPESLFGSAHPSGAHITITATSVFDNQSLTAPQLTLLEASGYHPSDRDGLTNKVAGTLNAASAFSALPGHIMDGNLKRLSTDFGNGYTERVDTVYADGITVGSTSFKTLTGRPEKISTTVESPGHGTEHAPDKHYTYWGNNTPLVEVEKIDADRDGSFNGPLDLVTTYTRGTRGRIESTTVTGYATASSPQHIGSYVASSVTSFDDRFDLPKVAKNAAPYLHPTTTDYHPFLGLPISVTDVNGVQVSTRYDALGRTLESTRTVNGKSIVTTQAYTADATQTVEGPPNCHGVAEGSGLTGVTGLTLTSAYKVVTTTTVQPTVTTYYDRLGRPIRTAKVSFSGTLVYTDTAYNNLGQVIAVSLPYPSGGTKYWTTTAYDALGRAQKVTAPNGTVTETTYIGRATKVKVDAGALDSGADPAPQTNTTLVDAKGRTVAVWNADNEPSFSDMLGSTTTPASIAFSLDGFGRMRTTALKGQNQQISATYDALGRQTQLVDPDKGTWTYRNNALGQVVRQADAKENVTLSTFDRLGRPLTRTTTQPGSPAIVETANFHYYDSFVDSELHLVANGSNGWTGAPQREEAVTTGAPGYSGTANSAWSTVNLHYYTREGLPEIELAQMDGQWFYTHHTYDSYHRLQQIRHFWRPPGFESAANSSHDWQDYGWTYLYDGSGSSSKSYLTSITDTSGRTWWDSPSYDHLDRVTDVRKGGALVTTRVYRPQDGVLSSIATGSVQSQTFRYDGLGNLRQRIGAGGTEILGYDNLNRLTNSSKQGTTNYSANGNITLKPDVEGAQPGADFAYADPAHPHAVTSAWGYTMAYDANGNLLRREKAGDQSAVTWAGFDKPRTMWRIKGGATTGSEFHYDAKRSRVMQLKFDSVTGTYPAQTPSHYTRKRLYGLGPSVEANYLNMVAGTAAPAWQLQSVRVYVNAPDGTVGTREYWPQAAAGATEKLYVYHHDHLGSVESITPHGSSAAALAADPAGKPGRFSEDAWGQRRDPLDWVGAPLTTDDGGADSLTPRGFTGHEMLDDLGLVHMNGRIYDPLLGRMLSADILVQNPGNLQAYNRYTYVLNNPLTLIDPSGFVYGDFEPGTVDPEALVKAAEAFANNKIVQGVGTTVAGFVPYVGDTMDAKDVVSPGTSAFERSVAGASLTVNAFTGGLAPNAGPIMRGLRQIGSGFADIFRGGSDASKAASDVAGAGAHAIGNTPTPHVEASAPIPSRVEIRAAPATAEIKSFASELKVSDTAARRHLRDAVPGTGGQVHHVLPWQSRDHEVVKRAAEGGFNINGAENGIRLGSDQHLGSHSKYNDAVAAKLDSILKANPDISADDAAKTVRNYIEQLRNGLERSSSHLK